MRKKTEEQRIKHQEHQRRYRARHPERIKLSRAKWKVEHPESISAAKRKSRQTLAAKRYKTSHPGYRATRNVTKAVRRGRLIRPDHCSRCGFICKPQAHHEDYGKPLEVIWLCKSCHTSHHGKPMHPIIFEAWKKRERRRGPAPKGGR